MECLFFLLKDGYYSDHSGHRLHHLDMYTSQEYGNIRVVNHFRCWGNHSLECWPTNFTISKLPFPHTHRLRTRNSWPPNVAWVKRPELETDFRTPGTYSELIPPTQCPKDLNYANVLYQGQAPPSVQRHFDILIYEQIAGAAGNNPINWVKLESEWIVSGVGHEQMIQGRTT